MPLNSTHSGLRYQQVVFAFGELSALLPLTESLEWHAPTLIVCDDARAAKHFGAQIKNSRVATIRPDHRACLSLFALLPGRKAARFVFVLGRPSNAAGVDQSYPELTVPLLLLARCHARSPNLEFRSHNGVQPQAPSPHDRAAVDAALAYPGRTLLLVAGLAVALLMLAYLRPLWCVGAITATALFELALRATTRIERNRLRRQNIFFSRDRIKAAELAGDSAVAPMPIGGRSLCLSQNIADVGLARSWKVSLDQNGCRLTAVPASSGSAARIVLAGCSFTFGHGVDDADTFGWRLQAEQPEFGVSNHGICAASPYQSLLDLEEYLPQHRTKFVVFGYHQALDYRNTAAWSVIEWFAGPWCQAVRDSTASAPSGLRLTRHAGDQRRRLPFSSSFKCLQLIEYGWNYLRLWRRSRPQIIHQTMQAVFLEMAALCQRHNAHLIVLLMGTGTEHRQFLEAAGIDICDPGLDLRERGADGKLIWLQPPFDLSHPNAAAHARFAAALSAKLQALRSGKMLELPRHEQVDQPRPEELSDAIYPLF